MAINVTRITPSIGFTVGVPKTVTIRFYDTHPLYNFLDDFSYQYAASFSLYSASSGGTKLVHDIAYYSKIERGTPPSNFETYYGSGEITITIPGNIGTGTFYIGATVEFIRGQSIPITVGGDTINIKFDRNGASGSNPQTATILRNGYVNIPYTDFMHHPGYTLAGWAISRTGNVAYIPGQTYPFAVSITLYAVWTPKTWTVSIDSNGGGGVSNSSYSTSKSSQTISISRPSTPSGKSFSHWEVTTQPSGQTIGTFTSNSFTINAEVYGNIIVKAIWNVITYSISYVLDGGQGAHGNPSWFEVNSPQINLQQGSMIKTGFSFIGWFTAASGGSQVTSIPTGSTGNRILYARWSINQYNVRFINEYTGVSTVMQTSNLNYNTPITYSGSTPTKTLEFTKRYTFIGWHYDKNSPIPLNSLGVVGTSAITFYAIYKENVARVKIGRRNIKINVGRTEAKKVYVGNKVVWENPNNE